MAIIMVIIILSRKAGGSEDESPRLKAERSKEKGKRTKVQG
jgi:hypothetical protein